VGANKKQKVFPALKPKSPEKGMQSVIEFISPPEIPADIYKVFIAQYHQPVDKKHQQVQHAIDLAGMVFPVSEVVFEMVSVVLQNIVIFVPCHPTGAGALRKQGCILFGYRFICNPTVFIRAFILLPVVNLEIQIIERQFLSVGTVLKAVYTLIVVFKIVYPRPNGGVQRFRDTPLDLFGYPWARFVFTGEYEVHPPDGNRPTCAVLGI
jgi:hypothetical protein